MEDLSSIDVQIICKNLSIGAKDLSNYLVAGST